MLAALTSLFYYILLAVLIFNFKAICLWLYHFVLFIRYKFKDVLSSIRDRSRPFKLFGVRVFTGRQGAGKTVSLVWYLDQCRKTYPKCKIYTNFSYKFSDGRIENLNDLLLFRNGTDGIIFAIDELQNEFSSKASRDFPESLLSTITMQRKQRICILATTQVFSRLAKPLREQCFEVYECRTFGGRWTRIRGYDANDYNALIDNFDPQKRFKLHKTYKSSFIQSDELRSEYDTMEVVSRLSRQGFVEKQ